MTRSPFYALLAAMLLGACIASSTGNDGGVPDAGDAGSLPDAGDAGLPQGGDGGPVVRATGSWSNVQLATSCPRTLGPPVGTTIDGVVNPNFSCATLTLSCPGLSDVEVTVALAGQSPGTTARGVVVTHGGGGGTQFFGGPLPQAWFDDGFNIAQVAWTGAWECPLGGAGDGGCVPDSTTVTSRPGVKDAACRPATIFRWVHEQAQLAAGGAFQPAATPFCGFGASGGSGALWYSLLYYGLSSELDYAVIAASTPFGRIDIGCDPSYAGQTVPATCSNVASPPAVPLLYTAAGPGPMNLLNTWSSTTTCDNGPSSDELAYWNRNSLVGEDADYGEATPVTTYDCVDVMGGTVNLVPAMNTYFFEQLRTVDPVGARFKALCVVNGTNGTCSGEGVFGDPNMADGGTLDMEQNCRLLAR